MFCFEATAIHSHMPCNAVHRDTTRTRTHLGAAALRFGALGRLPTAATVGGSRTTHLVPSVELHRHLGSAGGGRSGRMHRRVLQPTTSPVPVQMWEG